MNRIVLFGGIADGKVVNVNPNCKSIIIEGEKYHIINKYNLGFTEEVAGKANSFHYVFNEMLESYSATRTSGEMEAAKTALKKRVSEMFSFTPLVGFFAITIICFFAFGDIPKMFIAIPGAIYLFGFRAGFVEIKNKVKRL